MAVHFGCRHRQPLSRADEERHVLPAPRIEMDAHCRIRLDLRTGRDARLLDVSGVLAAHEVRAVERSYRSEHLHLLVAQRLAVVADRRFHREVRDDLQQVGAARSPGPVQGGAARTFPVRDSRRQIAGCAEQHERVAMSRAHDVGVLRMRIR
jgi:hypothetical protein